MIALFYLPLFEVPVWIEIRPKRYRCHRCEGRSTSTQSTRWDQRRSPKTKAYEQWLLHILVNSTVRDVNRDYVVSQRQVKSFDSFLTTVDHWLNEITNYFIERQTSGFVEGFNNRSKVLKRRCFGIFDVDRLFQCLTLDLQGYTRFPAI
jgi:transposase